MLFKGPRSTRPSCRCGEPSKSLVSRCVVVASWPVCVSLCYPHSVSIVFRMPPGRSRPSRRCVSPWCRAKGSGVPDAPFCPAASQRAFRAQCPGCAGSRPSCIAVGQFQTGPRSVNFRDVGFFIYTQSPPPLRASTFRPHSSGCLEPFLPLAAAVRLAPPPRRCECDSRPWGFCGQCSRGLGLCLPVAVPTVCACCRRGSGNPAAACSWSLPEVA